MDEADERHRQDQEAELLAMGRLLRNQLSAGFATLTNEERQAWVIRCYVLGALASECLILPLDIDEAKSALLTKIAGKF